MSHHRQLLHSPITSGSRFRREKIYSCKPGKPRRKMQLNRDQFSNISKGVLSNPKSRVPRRSRMISYCFSDWWESNKIDVWVRDVAMRSPTEVALPKPPNFKGSLQHHQSRCNRLTTKSPKKHTQLPPFHRPWSKYPLLTSKGTRRIRLCLLQPSWSRSKRNKRVKLPHPRPSPPISMASSAAITAISPFTAAASARRATTGSTSASTGAALGSDRLPRSLLRRGR